MPETFTVGDKAPLFTLSDEKGRQVDVESFQGKQPVVLIFYPGDDTPGCTRQLCAIRDDWAAFTSAGIAVFGVNHAGADSHQRFIDKHRLPLPILVDTGKTVSAMYGAIKKYFGKEVINRSVIVIDKQGIIRYLKRGLPPNSEFLPLAKELAQ